jgi:rod shape-determining protein MreD
MRIRNSLIFLTIFLTGLIQVTVLDYLALLGARPDFLLICVIFFALYFDKSTALKAAVLAGLFKDITSAALFGSNTLTLVLCVLFLIRYGSNFYKQNISTQILLSGFIYYASAFFVIFINYIISKNMHAHFSFYLLLIFKSAVYTGCISPILFFILSKIFNVRLIRA